MLKKFFYNIDIAGRFLSFPKITFLSFFILLIYNVSVAQDQLNFEHISTYNGLSSPIVHQTISDKYGFLWVATQDGLNKYDGYNFTVFRNLAKDKNSLSINNISSICEYNGNIWVGTWGGGLNKFDGNKKFTHFIKNPDDTTTLYDDHIQFLFKDKQNSLWVCTTSGLDRFNPEKKTFAHFIKGYRILSIFEDKSENLYAGTWQKIFSFNKERNKLKLFTIPKRNVTEIFADHSDTIWIGTDLGLFILDKITGKFTPFNWSKYKLYKCGNIYVKSIYEDTDRNIWIGTQKDGIFKLIRNEDRIVQINSEPDNPQRISYENIYHFNEDKSRILWVSTPGGGINKIDLKPPKFKHFVHVFNNPKSLTHNRVRSIYEEDNGKILFGTSYGLDEFDKNTNEFKYVKLPYSNMLPNKVPVTAIQNDKNGVLWIGTDKYKWFTYNRKTNKIIKVFKNLDHPYSDAIYDGREIVRDKNDNIWIGTNFGLLKYDSKTNKSTLYGKDYEPARLSANYINTVFADKDGIIWAGTGDGGLNRLDPKTNKIIYFRHDIRDSNSLSTDNIFCIAETDNYIWLGTPFGLNRLDKKTFRIKSYMEKDGLINLHISKILVDNDGNLWLATSTGLSEFNPATNRFVHYNKYTGLPNNEFNWTSSLKTRDGELFFGSVNGFISFYPKQITENKSIPPVVITSLKVFNEEKDPGADISGLKEIVLNYKENRISFEFASLDYTSPQSNRFKYKLIGFDKDWIQAGERRYANYTNLDPGTYTFHVIGSNNDNVWNNTGASIKLIIVPPFWQTLWFRISSSCIIITVAFIGFKMKVRKIEKSKNYLEKLNEQLIIENKERRQVEKELRKAKEAAEKSDKLKSEFLAQMSHEIRSPINTMFNFTELLKEDFDLEKDEEKKDIFDSIEIAGERIIRTIDLILNMSEIQTGSYECVYKKIELNKKISSIIFSEFGHKAKKKDIDLIFIPFEDEVFITADSYSMEQIFVNLIDNAIKYTKKGKVEVKTYYDMEKKICVDILDTGIGISEQYLPELFKPFSQEEQGYSRKYEGSGLGLALVKKYCEINNANVSVKSQKDKGTTFTVKFN